jgi:hypothetical protein
MQMLSKESVTTIAAVENQSLGRVQEIPIEVKGNGPFINTCTPGAELPIIDSAHPRLFPEIIQRNAQTSGGHCCSLVQQR